MTAMLQKSSVYIDPEDYSAGDLFQGWEMDSSTSIMEKKESPSKGAEISETASCVVQPCLNCSVKRRLSRPAADRTVQNLIACFYRR
jgi:hypothetical protein